MKKNKSKKPNQSKPSELLEPIGIPKSTPTSDGAVFEDDVIKELSGVKGLKQFQQMRTDDIVGGVYTAITKLLVKPDWEIKPFDDSAVAEANSKFLKECKSDLSKSFDKMIINALTMAQYGFSFFEMVYKMRSGETDDKNTSSKFTDGKIGWREFGARHPITLLEGGWNFADNDDGEIISVTQVTDNKTVTIPMEKSLHLVLDSEFEDPQGRSIFYSSYRNWVKKWKVEALESIGIERDLAGLPVIYAPESYFQNTTESIAKRTALEEAVSNIRRNDVEGVVLPSTFTTDGKQTTKLELLNSGGSRQFDINSTIGRLNLGMLTSMLADFMAVGHGGSGSFSLHSDKSSLFLTAIASMLDVIKDGLNDVEIPRLFKLNGITTELPRFSYTKLSEDDVNAFVDNIVKLENLGLALLTDLEVENTIRKALKLPISGDV